MFFFIKKTPQKQQQSYSGYIIERKISLMHRDICHKMK